MPPAITVSPRRVTPSRIYCTTPTSRSPKPSPSRARVWPLGKNCSLNVCLNEYSYLTDFQCFGLGRKLRYRARPWYTSSGGRAGRIPVSTETPWRAWLPDRSERQCSVPRGIRVQCLHELVAPIRHDLSTSPGRAHSTRKARAQSSARQAPHFHASRCLHRHHHSYEITDSE